MDDYKVFYDDARVGHYYVFDDEVRYSAFRRDDEDYSEDQKQLPLLISSRTGCVRKVLLLHAFREYRLCISFHQPCGM